MGTQHGDEQYIKLLEKLYSVGNKYMARNWLTYPSHVREEIVQSAVTKFATFFNPDRLIAGDESSSVAFFRTVLSGQVVDYGRRGANRELTILDGPLASLRLNDRGGDSEEKIREIDILVSLNQLLSPIQYDVFTSLMRGDSYSQIERALGISVYKIKKIHKDSTEIVSAHLEKVP